LKESGFLQRDLFEIFVDERTLEQSKAKLSAKDIPHRIVDRFHRDLAAFEQFLAILVERPADHLHIRAGI